MGKSPAAKYVIDSVPSYSVILNCDGLNKSQNVCVIDSLIFNRVIDGLETLDEIEKLPVNEKTFRPLTETRIKDVTVHANPFAG